MKYFSRYFVFMFSMFLVGATLAQGQTKPFKVALMGDTGSGRAFGKVLEMALEEKSDLIMVNGDLGYGRGVRAWRNRVTSIVDTSKTSVIGSLGNHDVERGQAQGYIEALHSLRNDQNQLTEKCTGEPLEAGGADITAVNEVCTFGNLTVAASAIGQQALNRPIDYYEEALRQKLRDAPADHWKLVGYHYTLHSMNPGLKGDQATHKFFDIIRQFGAIGAQGHTHSAMASCPISSVFKIGEPVECHPDFTDLEKRFVAPGVGVFVDSSISGKDVRRRKRCHQGDEDECRHMVDLISQRGYTRVDGVKDSSANAFGAIFITFNVDGDPNRAHAYFKNLNGKVVFQFSLNR